MNVLVTGGAGFIGSHTVDLLLAQGYDVRILDTVQPRVHPRGTPDYLPAEGEFLQGDVSHRADLERALTGVEYVFHLVYATAGVGEYWIVDPDRRQIEVFVLRRGVYELIGRCGPGEQARSEVLSGFQIGVDEVCP